MENNIRTSGVSKADTDAAGGAVLVPHLCIGIVKDNIDHTHSGRIKVYIGKGGSSDENNDKGWIGVSYMSPYFGIIAPGYNIYGGSGSSAEGYGKYIGNPHSYGFWATAPDVGTKVLCLFVNGRQDNGYYIGCVPEPGLTHMVPAIGATNLAVPNSEEAKTYGGADRLPGTEVNNANPAIRNSPTIYNQPKPVHSYQASILSNQGLVRDNLRGVISSSSQRETPSRVFGISTPGGPVYSGGYDKTNIRQVAETADISKLQTIGRTGGHTFVMDDGTTEGQDQLIRLRTSAGHMIMMNDSGQNLTVIHSNGRSWVELGREGTVDVYSQNSVNIRTEGDLNIHADRDINMHAKRDIKMYAENSIQLQSEKNTQMRAGQDFNQYTVAKHTVKVDGPMSYESKADASFHSKAITYINGVKKIHLNTGSTGTVPQVVNMLPREKHVDTTFSPNKGWVAPSPDPLQTIATRTPAHWPWVEAGKGVDVKTGSAQPGSPPQPSAGVVAATAASATQLGAQTSSALTATAPAANPVAAAGGLPKLPAQTVQSMVGQQAAAAGALSAADKVKNGIVGTAGSTLSQLAAPGQSMKPGSDFLVKSIQNAVPNIPGAKAATNVLMTGNAGVGSFANLERNIAAQTGAVTGALNAGMQGLKNASVLSGTETPTEIAGVVQAAANFGAKAVSSALSNPVTATSSLLGGTSTLNSKSGLGSGSPGASVGSAFGSLGGAIAGGTFSGLLADKAGNGMNGVSSALGSLANGSGLGDLGKTAVSSALGGATSTVGALTGGLGGLTGLAGGVLGGLKGNLGNLKGTAFNAFSVAEKSFGELKGGQPNFLGGLSLNLTASPITDALNAQGRATQDFDAAQQELAEAKKLARLEPSAENTAKVAEAEAKVAEAKKKSFSAVKDAIASKTPSAQNISEAAAAATSGSASTSTTANSGVNALPGGLGAFANEVSATANNAIGSAKSLASNVAGGVSGAAGGLSGLASGALGAATSAVGNVLGNVKNLAGNIVNNAQQALTNVANGIGNQVQAAAGALGGLAGGGAAALGSIVGGAKNAVAGVFSKAQAALGSLGNNNNQIKTPILASDTFAPEKTIMAKTSQLLGDSKIPKPEFPDKPVEPPKDVARAQMSAMEKINKFSELDAERKKLSTKFAALYTELRQLTGNEGNYKQVVEEYDAVKKQLADVEARIAALVNS